MRISAATVITTAFAAAPVSRCAPFLTHNAAALAYPPSKASTTLMATNKLHFRPDVAAGAPSSPFGRTPASVIKPDEPATDELTARAVSEDVDVLEAVITFVKDLDEAVKEHSDPSLATVELPLFSSGKWKAAAWAAHDPALARAVKEMRSKLPKHLNGTPDLDALARIGPEKRLASKYVRLQRLIANLSRRTRRNAAKARAKLDAPPSASSEGFSKTKRKLHSAGNDDLQAARAFVASPGLPRKLGGRVNVHQLSSDQLRAYHEAQRILDNNRVKEKRKVRKLLLRSTPGGSAAESAEQGFRLNAASSTGTDGAASVSSAATHRHDPAASLSQEPLPPSILLQPHTPAVSSLSPLPPQPRVEHAAPPTSSRIPSHLLRWPSFGVPMYSPSHFLR